MIDLIIPDIHLKTDRADFILRKEPHDHATFLGDYFDDFGDTPADNSKTALWLKSHLDDLNKTFLLGNHDLHYRVVNNKTVCSGFSVPKFKAINTVLHPNDWNLLHVCSYVQGFFLTHAGVHPCLFSKDVKSLAELITEGYQDTIHDVFSPYFAAGRSRGGSAEYGGITWLDYREFTPIKGFSQIFGHTPSLEVRRIVGGSSDNYCLDTHMKHYAVIQDGVVSIKETNFKE